ncbi:hypothetical protein MIMGU_mgv1a024519mg [Erythranthe guttata]|uniref:Pentacotripeptide-repeat region of PRORP domain-containing protein n=1 Tax=Erythranthe guttata TaxID=4155 RepID=A0A022RTF4_ERYGU|nr:hypothetical protein MIMGU_mgv1a024519mg [Erythranthe guttata]
MPTFRALFKSFYSLHRKTFTNSSTHASIAAARVKNRGVGPDRRHFKEPPSHDVYLSTKMISSHVENYRLADALHLFDETSEKDTVMWNLMIKGCVTCGNLDMGLRLFNEMPEKNVISWTTVINAFLKYGMIEEAKGLFRKMPVRDTASWNAMVHGFFVNRRVEEAIKLFEEMPDRNVISWTTMISGLDQHGRSDEALSYFVKMVGFGVKPTSNTFSCAITSCANVQDLYLGRQVHGHVLKLGYVSDMFITASLITFYANCKQIEECAKAFNEKFHPNVVVWTSLLTGYGANGKHENALGVFSNMIRVGIIPNQSSFTSALNSSREIEAFDWGKGIHCGAFKMGLENDCLTRYSKVEVKIEHYACMVDILCRSGELDEAERLVKEMPMEANLSVWLALLSGCRGPQADLEIAERAAKRIFCIDPKCGAAYVLMSNIYASAGKWNEVARIRRKMKEVGTVKQPGIQWID